MQNYPRVAIIILNWNGWKDTIECLTSIQQLEYPNYCMVVIDNGSTDDSVEKIKLWGCGKIPIESKFFTHYYTTKMQRIVAYDQATAENGGIEEEEKYLLHIASPLKLVIIKCSKNYGFAKGNNIGLSYSLKNNYDYMWILNNDTVVDKKSLMNLLKPFTIDTQVGMTGSKICYYNEPNLIWFAGAKIHWLRGESFHFKENRYYNKQSELFINVERITGCSMLVSADLCRKIGLLDENFFLYVEEIDWCLRASKKNYKIVYVPTSIVYHKIIRAENSTSYYTAFYCYYQTRNFLYLIIKHIEVPKRFIYLFIVVGYKLVLAVKNFIEVRIGRKKSVSYPYIIRGIYDFCKNRFGEREI